VSASTPQAAQGVVTLHMTTSRWLVCFVVVGVVLSAAATSAKAQPPPKAPVSKLVAAQETALRTMVDALYAPYKSDNPQAFTDRDVFSADTTQRLKQWRSKGPRDEVDDVSDGDWLCSCQDWDPAFFRVVTLELTPIAGGRVSANVTLQLFSDKNEVRNIRLIVVEEKLQWRIDDVFNVGNNIGLKAALGVNEAKPS
jgi:opacity protein-like surface antigen